MIKPDKLYCQIIWYTKSWFKTTNKIEDIKILMGHYFGSKPQYYNLGDVYRILIYTMESVQINFADFMKNEMFKWNDNANSNSITINHIIERMLGVISIIPIKNLELGEPDYSWLPKKEE